MKNKKRKKMAVEIPLWLRMLFIIAVISATIYCVVALLYAEWILLMDYDLKKISNVTSLQFMIPIVIVAWVIAKLYYTIKEIDDNSEY